MKLEEFDPKNYHRTLEITTREKRDNETNMWDYEFMTPHEYQILLNSDELFESVENQFYPAQYGARYSELQENKWNVVVASIEGFLSSLNHIGHDGVHYLVNIINDDTLDIEREGRNPKAEENLNLAVLKNLCQNFYCMKEDQVVTFNYTEIKYSDLKEYRNDKDKVLLTFKDILEESEA